MPARVDFWRGTKEELNARKENHGFNDGDLLFSIDNDNGINTIEQATLIDDTLEYIPYGSSYDGSDALKINSVRLRVNLGGNEGVTLQPGNNAPGVRGVLPIEHGGTGSDDTNISDGDFLVGVAASQGQDGENVPAHYERMSSADVSDMLMNDKYLNKVGSKDDDGETVVSIAWNDNSGLVLENSSSSNEVGYTIKQTNLDLTQQDNAITSENGFMVDGFTVVDKNNNIASRFENFADDNGENGFKIYSKQYFENGKSVYSGVDSDENPSGEEQWGVQLRIPKETDVTSTNSPRATWEFFPNWYLETSPILLEGNYYLHSDSWDISLSNNGLDSGSHITQGLVFRDKNKANGGMLAWTANDDGTITSVLGNSANGSVRGLEISSGGKTSDVGNVLVRNAYLNTNHHVYITSYNLTGSETETTQGQVLAFNYPDGKQLGQLAPRFIDAEDAAVSGEKSSVYAMELYSRYLTSTNTNVFNRLRLGIGPSGDAHVYVNQPAAWRSGLGITSVFAYRTSSLNMIAGEPGDYSPTTVVPNLSSGVTNEDHDFVASSAGGGITIGRTGNVKIVAMARINSTTAGRAAIGISKTDTNGDRTIIIGGGNLTYSSLMAGVDSGIYLVENHSFSAGEILHFTITPSVAATCKGLFVHLSFSD